MFRQKVEGSPNQSNLEVRQKFATSLYGQKLRERRGPECGGNVRTPSSGLNDQRVDSILSAYVSFYSFVVSFKAFFISPSSVSDRDFRVRALGDLIILP